MRRMSAIVSIGLMFSSALAVPRPAFAQKKVSTDQVSGWGSFIWTCLKAKFPEISLSGDGRSAFDPDSKRNFARDGDTWIDVKTGEAVCPVKRSDGGWSGWGRFIWTCLKARFPEISLSGDGRSAFDPDSKRNFARDGDTWIDVKTGEVICPKLKPSTAQQPTPPTGSQVGSVPALKLDRWEERILDLHNAERALVGAPPLRWNAALEASATTYAQQLARTGRLVHASRQGRGTERENVNQGMIGWNVNQMMATWLNEKPFFTPGIFPNVSTTGDWSEVGHYTQIIWPQTTGIGCGMATGSGYQWLVCRYSPGGNREGHAVGQPPVITGDANSVKAAPPQPVRYQWIDVKTGKPVTDRPVITTNGKTYYVQANIDDPNRAFDPESGRNFARNEHGDWIDVKTGKPVTSRPVVTTNGDTYYVQANIGEPNRAFDSKSGRNFAKVPVPPK